MAAIHQFEDLDCWKMARTLCQLVYEVTGQGGFAKDFSLKDQINRSSGSTMDNIAEGFERGGNKEFIQFLFISKASCAEVKSQLYRAHDRGYISKAKLEEIYTVANDTASRIQGLISYLHQSSSKGFKQRSPK